MSFLRRLAAVAVPLALVTGASAMEPTSPDDAKASGLVAQAIARAGLRGVNAAP